MADIIVSLTKRGRELEAQQLLYGYGFRIDFFQVGSGGHDPGNPTLALPLDEDVLELPGAFFGPEPIDTGILITSTCPRWTCIIQPGEGVGAMSNFGLVATVVYVPAASFFIQPIDVTAGSSNKNFGIADVNVATETITIAGHGFVNTDQVVFASSGGLPTGLNSTTPYYIVGATGTTFQVSLTNGGPAVDITTQGTGIHTVRLAGDDTILKNTHGLVDGNEVNMITTGTMPGGLTEAQTYYVVQSNANTFKLSSVPGGPPIDITSSGTGIHTVTNLSSLPGSAPLVGSTFLYAQANFPLRTKLSSSRETYNVTLQT